MASTAAFVDLLRQHHLLEPAQLEEANRLKDSFADAKALAGELIKRRWLTPYQVNQIFLPSPLYSGERGWGRGGKETAMSRNSMAGWS